MFTRERAHGDKLFSPPLPTPLPKIELLERNRGTDKTPSASPTQSHPNGAARGFVNFMKAPQRPHASPHKFRSESARAHKVYPPGGPAREGEISRDKSLKVV